MSKGREKPKNPEESTRAEKVYQPSKGHLQAPFLAEYQKSESISAAAEAVGINAGTVTAWKRDPKFLAAFTEAHLAAQQKNNDTLKKTTLSLGLHGNPHYLIDRKTNQYVLDKAGNRMVLYREFYPNLNQFLLKNRLPDEFKDKFEYEINGQLIVTLASEFIAIVRRNAPPEIATSIEKELEMLSTKLATT